MLGLRLFVFLFIVASLMAGSDHALAFVRSMSSTGLPLFWPSPSVVLRGNPVNSSGLSEAQVADQMSNSFAAWSSAGTRASMPYTQSPGNPASSGINGQNSVYFASHGGRNLGWGVVAVTEVLYFVANGQIAEADMVFNDNQFRFTTTEGDTGKSIGGRTAIYLRDVATHEAGHVLGLDHSLANGSSLIYTAFSGQFVPGGDDTSAVRTIYPNGAVVGGALAGSIQGTQGGIFGAHLTAINLSNGKVEAGSLSNADGSFRLGDLPVGKYAVMMEPFGTNISAVSSYFENVNHRFCSGSRFRRRFYSACGAQGIASVVEVSAGSQTQLGSLTPSCSSMGNPGGPPNSIATARELPAAGGAGFGSMRPGDTHYYIVRNVAGLLSARAMSYSLYSPVDVKLQILNSDGSALAGATSVDNVQDPLPGGHTNFDSSASANVTTGDYLVQVTTAGQRVPASKFPAGYELLDIDGHYLLALGVNGEFGPSVVTDMSACLSVRNVAQSASFRTLEGSEERERAAGCGSLNSGGTPPFSGGMMQVFLTALGLHTMIWLRRLRLRAGLVRKRR